MCPRCEGLGEASDIDLDELFDRTKSLADGATHDPRLQRRRLDGEGVHRVGVRRPEQADQGLHRAGAPGLPLQGAHEGQDPGLQHDLRGPRPEDHQVDAPEGPRLAAAAHPRLRRARRQVHRVPRLRRHPAERGRALLEDQGRQHRGCRGHADHGSRRVARHRRRPRGRAADGGPARDDRLLRRHRPRLPLARPRVGHAVGRRGAAHQDDPPPRIRPHRHQLRLRRADRGASSARHPADERAAEAPARQGQHRARRRAQARGHRDRRPHRRPRARGRPRGRRSPVHRDRRGPALVGHDHGPPPR